MAGNLIGRFSLIKLYELRYEFMDNKQDYGLRFTALSS